MTKKNLPERAYVFGIHTPRNANKYEAYESYEEAKNLSHTAGADLVYADFIDIRQYNPSTLLGQGKVDEIKIKIYSEKPDIVIIDHELSPVQNRNLEEIWQTRVVDRTSLILDIFSQRARSKEGKLQVELAQYEYLLPRLVGAWTHLSKQRGGIGLRGPGETQLEVDRRRVREKISFIKKDLKKVSSAREIHRSKRQSVPIPTISLIGYTNAGKSTLFNRITGACELAEDRLFATLDPKTKKLRLPSGQKVLVSDTVGFIRSLPLELFESFKSTFEEVAQSDLLVHVIDASHPDRAQQIETVEKILTEMGLDDKPTIRVMNKIDKIEVDLFTLNTLESAGSTVKISGLEGYGLDNLLAKIQDKLSQTYYRRMNLLIPYSAGRALNELYTHGSVLSNTTTHEGAVIQVDLPEKWQNMFMQYAVA